MKFEIIEVALANGDFVSHDVEANGPVEAMANLFDEVDSEMIKYLEKNIKNVRENEWKDKGEEFLYIIRLVK